MALAITAPVIPAPASGQQNVQEHVEAIAGEALPDIVGTSATSGGSVKIEIVGPDGLDVTFFVTATLFAFTTAGKFSYIPEEDGIYEITVTDVTADSSVSTTVEVFKSA